MSKKKAPENKPASKQRPPPPVEHRWKPGQSGNPSGVAKGMADVRRAARTYTAEAIDTLAKWMRTDNAKASISAAVALLNRGWGMPQQNIKATIADFRAMTDAELTEYLVTGEHDEIGSGAGTLEAPGDTRRPH